MVRVLVVLASGFEEIEAVTIIDLLRRAEIGVTMAGLHADFEKGSHGITIKTDRHIKSILSADFDALVLPGGRPGTDNLINSREIIELVQEFHKDKKLLGAICAAPTILNKAGIISETTVTSYPADARSFNKAYYSVSSVVEDKNIITSRGVGTAIPFTLNLIRHLAGEEKAWVVAKAILYKGRF